MPVIDKLVIQIDSDGFLKAEGNGKVFEELLKRIQGESTKTEKSVKGLGDNFAAFQLITNKLPPVLRSVASGLLGFVSPAHAAVGAFVELTEAAVNFAKGSLEAFSQYEMIQTNLELVMGSAESATATFGELRDLAAKTPFSLPGVAQAASMLRQAGVAAGDLVGTIEMLGNVSGGNMERFNRISYNYTQVLQKGILDARDTREFAGNLVPIQQALQAIGVTGKATADDMVRAFQYMTREGGMFFNAMYRQGDTLIGKMDQWKEAWAAFQATFAETSGLASAWKWFVEKVTGGLQDAIVGMNHFSKAQNAINNIMSGNGTPEYFVDLENALEYLSTTKNITEEEWHLKKEIEEILAQEADVLDLYRQEVELQKQRTTSEEDWQATVKDSNAEYLDIQNQIQDAYAKTAKGQAEALMKETAKWRELQKAAFWQQQNGEWKLTGINPQEFQQIEEYLKFLEESGKKAKTELSDWQQLLQSTLDVSDQAALSGMTALEEYTAGFYDRLGGALAYAQMAGENAADVYGEFADEIERAMKALMRSGKFNINDTAIKELSDLFKRITQDEQALKNYDAYIDSYVDLNDKQVRAGLNDREAKIFDIAKSMSYSGDDIGLLIKAVEKYEELAEIVPDFSKYGALLGAMKRGDIFSPEIFMMDDEAGQQMAMTKKLAEGGANADGLIEINTLLMQIGATADKDIPRISTLLGLIENDESKSKEQRGTKYVSSLEAQLDLEKQLASGEITRNEYAAQMLAIQQDINIEDARNAINLQNQIRVYELMRDLLQQIGKTSLSSVIDMARELGEAFRDGKDAGDAWSDAFGNMMRRIVDALPQLFLSAGLQALIAGNVPLGLALIGASGLSAFVSGMISDSERDNAEDQLAKLQKIQDAIANLIDQQKSLEEYYFKKRQELNAKAAMSVNDLIVTPQGTWSTHPDDYIIATRNPAELGERNVIAPISVQIINNTSANIDMQEQNGYDGKKLLIMVDNMVKNNIATGRYDGALQAQQSRNVGRRITTA